MGQSKKIIVVDDDHDLRRTICDFLVTRGYDVHQAADGNNAISLIKNDEPALVLTDILMPDKEGISTIRDIRRDHQNVKIIAMSGGGQFNRVDVLKSAGALGADAALAKPFDLDELESTIKKLI